MSRKVEHLHPLMRLIVAAFIATAWTRVGVRLKLIETWRDNTKQREHWMKGRDEHGRIINKKRVVTHKRPGDSWHNLQLKSGAPASLAAHLVPELPGGGLIGYGNSQLGKPELAIYRAVVYIGLSFGMRSGADWDEDGKIMEHGEDDLGHWEYHPGFHLAEAKAVLAKGDDLASLVIT